MGSYTSEYPSTQLDPAFKHFFEEFYKISDTPDGHQQYANQFTANGKLIMASKTVNGTSGNNATERKREMSCFTVPLHSFVLMYANNP